MELNGEGDMGVNDLLHAQVHLWSYGLSFLKSMSLKCAVELGIPDVLHMHGKAITLAELVTALSLPPATAGSMRRLMRSLVRSGIFAMQTNDTEELYLLTPTSRLLVKDERSCFAPFIRLILDPIMLDPSHLLGLSFKECAPSPFYSCHRNKAIWDVADENPRFNTLFNEGMASDARFVAEVMLRGGCKDVFEGVRSLVDVGGGTGTVAVAVAEAHPQMKCTVFDLPHVIATVPKNTTVDFVGGDMFEHIPTADTVLLKSILHDWSDEDCIRILKRCKEAISCKDGGKVIIMDMVVGIAIGNQVSLETQLLFDLEMMTLTTGKERDEGEWQKIFSAAGFHHYKITPSLGLRSIIQVYP